LAASTKSNKSQPEGQPGSAIEISLWTAMADLYGLCIRQAKILPRVKLEIKIFC